MDNFFANSLVNNLFDCLHYIDLTGNKQFIE